MWTFQFRNHGKIGANSRKKLQGENQSLLTTNRGSLSGKQELLRHNQNVLRLIPISGLATQLSAHQRQSTWTGIRCLWNRQGLVRSLLITPHSRPRGIHPLPLPVLLPPPASRSRSSSVLHTCCCREETAPVPVSICRLPQGAFPSDMGCGRQHPGQRQLPLVDSVPAGETHAAGGLLVGNNPSGMDCAAL